MLLGLYAFLVYLKASSFHKCLQSTYCADLCQNMCVGQHYLLGDSSLKMPEISIALQTHRVNQNDLLTNAVVWKSTSSSFVPHFFLFLSLLKDVSRSQWSCPSVIEIFTETAILLALVAARLGHPCMMLDWGLGFNTVNRCRSLALFWSWENSDLSTVVDSCLENSILSLFSTFQDFASGSLARVTVVLWLFMFPEWDVLFSFVLATETSLILYYSIKCRDFLLGSFC